MVRTFESRAATRPVYRESTPASAAGRWWSAAQRPARSSAGCIRGNWIDARRITHVRVKDQPQSGAAARRPTTASDAVLVNLPFGGFAAHELQSTGCIF